MGKNQKDQRQGSTYYCSYRGQNTVGWMHRYNNICVHSQHTIVSKKNMQLLNYIYKSTFFFSYII